MRLLYQAKQGSLELGDNNTNPVVAKFKRAQDKKGKFYNPSLLLDDIFGHAES